MKFDFSPCAEPVTESDEFIRAALQDASIPALMMSMIHMSGDLSLLDSPIRPDLPGLYDIQGSMSEADKAAIREQALDVIVRYRDAGNPEPFVPERADVVRMMEFAIASEVESAYAEMFFEELALYEEDRKLFRWEDLPPRERREDFKVVIIGAGMSGVLAAIQLDLAGIPYVVIEKNPEVGGTWLENTYPGCRVDTPSHFYSYSFETSDDWPSFFPLQSTMYDYFRNTTKKYGVREKIRFDTEVTSMSFDESSQAWDLELRNPDGSTERIEANAVISAVGQLNRPKIPDFPGKDSFEGPSFHTAQWDNRVDLSGKRVALIGTGASGFQVGPEIAKIAKELIVFQRSPAWAFPNPIYHSEISEEQRWLLRHLPYYNRWLRFVLFWPGSDQAVKNVFPADDWEHPDRAMNADNDEMREGLTEWIRSQVGDDPELFEKVLPKYPPFGKRLLQDNGNWLGCLSSPHVSLVTDEVAEIGKGTIRTAQRDYDVDVIVYATGFHGSQFLHPMKIRGRDGVELDSLWDEEPRAFLGITVPKFPNLFCLYGPSTNLATSGTITILAEFQVRYVMESLKLLIESGHRSMECREEVNDYFNARLREVNSKSVYEHPAVTSHYQNRHGHNVLTMPWRLVDYRQWTLKPDPEHYVLK